ncbi:hypothetical protein LTS18_010858, partial [Coniosporium uncinatum]
MVNPSAVITSNGLNKWGSTDSHGEKDAEYPPRGKHVETVDPTEVLISPELDKRLNRKFDLHIVPWLFGLWLLAFIDRSNIGNARIDGLAEQLHLDGT